MRYLPFIIISFVLYALFFYNNQQPELLSASSKTNTAEKVVPLDFKKLTEQEKQSIVPDSSVTLHTEESPVVVTAQTPLEDKTTKKKLIATAQSKRNLQQFKTSIKSIPASEGALLKGEFYERDFHLDLPAPPKQIKAPKKIKTTSKKVTKPKKATTKVIPETKQDSLSSKLLKIQQTGNDATTKKTATESSKPKRSFKKQVKQLQISGEQLLQEAIAVSGNKPHYPKIAKSNNQQGVVTVKFTVNMQGKTKNVQIAKSSGHTLLDAAVVEFIKKERFMPALKGIEKVTSEQQFSFEFSLK
ncbi:MAG: energy transducer TonB [Psychromonas sp.]|nr:energy transducer TonB [Alteromonadales bacterium]MCP5077741.1 energy transducer TonB [Psychromonas sp.]